MINEMPLHKHFQTVIHAPTDNIPPIIFPLLMNLICTILYKLQEEEKKEPVCCAATYLFRLAMSGKKREHHSPIK